MHHSLNAIRAVGPKKHLVFCPLGGTGIRIAIQTGGIGRSESQAFANAIYLDTDLSFLDTAGQSFERGGGCAVALGGADTRGFVDAALNHRSQSTAAKKIRKLLHGFDPELIARGILGVSSGEGSSGIRTFSACAVLAQQHRILELVQQKVAAAKTHAAGVGDRLEFVYALSADGAGGGGSICPLIELLAAKFSGLDHSVYLLTHRPDELSNGSDARAALLQANTQSTLEELQALSRQLNGNRSRNNTLQINFLDGSSLNLTRDELVRDRALLLHGLYNLNAADHIKARSINDETVRPRGPLVLSAPVARYGMPFELLSFGAAVAELQLAQRMLSSTVATVGLEGFLPRPLAEGLPQDHSQSLLASTSLAGATALFSKLQGELLEAGREFHSGDVASAEAEKVRILGGLPQELGKMLTINHVNPVWAGVRAAVVTTEKALATASEREKSCSSAANLADDEIGKGDESLWCKLKALPLSQRAALGAGGIFGVILLGLSEPLTVAFGACLLLASALGGFALLRHGNPSLAQFTEKAVSCLIARRQAIGLRREQALLGARLQALGELSVTLESLRNELQRKVAGLQREIEVWQKRSDMPGSHVPIRPDSFPKIVQAWGPAVSPEFEGIDPSVVLTKLKWAAEAHAAAAFGRLRLKDFRVGEHQAEMMTQLANSLLAWTSLPSGHLGSVDDLPRFELHSVANTGELVDGETEFRRLVRSPENAAELFLFGMQRGLKVEQLDIYPELKAAAEVVRDIPTATLVPDPSSEHPRPVPPAKDRDAVPHGRRVNGVNGTHEYSSVTV